MPTTEQVGDSDSAAQAPSHGSRTAQTQPPQGTRPDSQQSSTGHRSGGSRLRDPNRRPGDSGSKGSKNDGEAKDTSRLPATPADKPLSKIDGEEKGASRPPAPPADKAKSQADGEEKGASRPPAPPSDKGRPTTDGEAKGTSRPAPADKARPQTSVKETKAGRTGETDRSDSPLSTGSFEYVGEVFEEQPEVKSRAGNISRSSTKDDSLPPPGLDRTQSRVPATSRPPRSDQPPTRPSSKTTTTTAGQPNASKPPSQPPSQPPQGQGDTRATSSYANVASQVAHSGPGDPRSQAVRGNETQPSEMYPPNQQLPGAHQDMDVDSVQQMEQAHYAQHASQGGDPTEISSYANYGGLGIGLGAIRSLIGGGGPSPPRDRTRDDLYRALGAIENLKADRKREREEYRGLVYAYRESEQDRSRLKDNVRSLQHELDNVRRELGEAKALSEIRGRELVGAQVFLTKADSLSISEVIDKVNILNEEIFQAAASLGETLMYVKREGTEEEMQHHCERAFKFIGEPMVNVLLDQAQRQDPEVNMLIVQAALSIFLVGFCLSKLGSWHQSDKDIDSFLGALYNQVRASEEQAVSGRWRALTRSKMRPSSDDWKVELMRDLRSVLIIARWGSPNSKDQEVSFLQKLVPIFKAVEDLRIAVGEKFTSADLEVNFAGAKFQFDHNWMEDAYGDGRQAGGRPITKEVVVGTVGLGLKKVLKELGSRGEEMFGPVLAPKVVLESTLREALDPPPPTKRNKRKPAPEGGN